MMEMAAKDIERLGGTVEFVDIGKQQVSAIAPLNPILLIQFFVLVLCAKRLS